MLQRRRGRSSSSRFERVYETVREAQAAVRRGRPGVLAQHVDRVAQGIIEDAGLGERFIHRTGHGIGSRCTSPPYIVEGNEWLRARHDVLRRARRLLRG